MQKDLSTLEYGLAGAASGIFTRFSCQPFDVLKIRLQIQSSPISKLGLQSSQLPYKSLLHAVIKISRDEGVHALWKGHVPAQWLSAIYGAGQFATYEMFTKMWEKNSFAHFGGGAASGVFAVLISFPFDVIRTRLVAQGETRVYRNMRDAGMQIVKNEGWRAFFKGLTPACIHIAPMSGLVFGLNHIFTTFVRKINGKQSKLSPGENLACGGLAGFGAKMAVYPFDLVKKRLQLQGMPDGYSPSGPIMRTSGLLHCLSTIVRLEGIRGLYKGLSPSLLKAVVSNSIYLTSYNISCQFFYK